MNTPRTLYRTCIKETQNTTSRTTILWSLGVGLTSQCRTVLGTVFNPSLRTVRMRIPWLPLLHMASYCCFLSRYPLNMHALLCIFLVSINESGRKYVYYEYWRYQHNVLSARVLFALFILANTDPRQPSKRKCFHDLGTSPSSFTLAKTGVK